MALSPVPATLLVGSAVYGVTIGTVPTLSPIVVRREFGAAAFGAVYGMAGTDIGLISALGPGFFGLLHDAFGGYRAPLLISAVIDVLAAAIVVLGGRVLLDQPRACAHRWCSTNSFDQQTGW
jgi:cyanate permease